MGHKVVAVSNEYLKYPTPMLDTACWNVLCQIIPTNLDVDQAGSRAAFMGITAGCQGDYLIWEAINYAMTGKSLGDLVQSFQFNGCIQYGSLLQCFCID